MRRMPVLSDLRVGTFYLVSGSTYKCRDSVLIGSVTAGSKQVFSGLSLDAVAGDFIGCYLLEEGRLEKDSSGYGGYYRKYGEYIDPDDQAEYELLDGGAVGLCGLMTENSVTSFVYDGDGNRVMKTENGETILYVNRYYEKNLDTGVVTTYYYLGSRLVAMREGTELKYTHQDHLSSTSVMTDDSGDSLGAIKYLPFGETRSGSVPTDKLFTGQRLDGTGLYYYNARYYDPTMGRFISADTIVPDFTNPQALIACDDEVVCV